MAPVIPKTSPRLARAATAERAVLHRERERLLARREELQSLIEHIEHELVAVEEQIALLNRLSPPDAEQPANGTGGSKPHSDNAVTGEEVDTELLRGTAIRETAVRLLAQSADAGRPVHYRRLYELLSEAGLAVAGKNPLATFLTQLSRSPVMRKTTQAGIYELDNDAPGRLRRRLAQLQSELRAVTGNPAPTDDLAEIRQRRERVLLEVVQTERSLDEAERVLGLSSNGAAVAPPRRAA